MHGEEVKQQFSLIADNPIDPVEVLDISGAITADCPTCLTILADTLDDNQFRNDKTSFLFRYSNAVTAISIKLQLKNGVFADVATLNDNTYGTFFALGFIVDDKNRSYIGYLVDWRLVLAAFGEGFYRVVTDETTIFGANSQTTAEYCLKTYLANRAEGSLKIETYTTQIRGDINDQTDFIDFGTAAWYNSTRLCGIFGFDTSDYTDERVEFRNGQRKWITDIQETKYLMALKPIPQELHNFVKTDILQADEIFITDYNKNNPNKHIQTLVLRDGNYEPNWNANTLLASVEVQFKTAYNNLRKRRC